MKKFDLYFMLKGDRNYVHGTDIYTKILQHLTPEIKIHNIDLSFHKVVKNNLTAEFVSPGAEILNTTSPAAVFKYESNSEKYTIHLNETNTTANERYKYDEESVVKEATFYSEEKSIKLTSANQYTNIEKIVALNKALLNKLFSDAGKWYFTRITVKDDINKEVVNTFKLQLIKNIGSKITKSVIFFDGNERGFIYFSKV